MDLINDAIFIEVFPASDSSQRQILIGTLMLKLCTEISKRKTGLFGCYFKRFCFNMHLLRNGGGNTGTTEIKQPDNRSILKTKYPSQLTSMTRSFLYIRP